VLGTLLVEGVVQQGTPWWSASVGPPGAAPAPASGLSPPSPSAARVSPHDHKHMPHHSGPLQPLSRAYPALDWRPRGTTGRMPSGAGLAPWRRAHRGHDVVVSHFDVVQQLRELPLIGQGPYVRESCGCRGRLHIPVTDLDRQHRDTRAGTDLDKQRRDTSPALNGQLQRQPRAPRTTAASADGGSVEDRALAGSVTPAPAPAPRPAPHLSRRPMPTLSTGGLVDRPKAGSLTPSHRCARRMGSSCCKNWAACSKLRSEGQAPCAIMYCRLTPVCFFSEQR